MKVISLKILLEKGILMSAVKRVVFGRIVIFSGTLYSSLQSSKIEAYSKSRSEVVILQIS
jgi:hypothetical protein